jgi:hypothetical protein
MPTPNFLDGPSTPLPSARTDGCGSDFKTSTSASCSGLKILVELGSHSIRRQASDQKRAGKAQHQHQIRAGSQHRQGRGTAQAVFRQGLLESSEASAQCCYSQHSIRLSPRSGCYPVRSGCYSGLPLFKTSLPANQMGHSEMAPLTLGEHPGSRRDSQSGRGPARKRLR